MKKGQYRPLIISIRFKHYFFLEGALAGAFAGALAGSFLAGADLAIFIHP
ncbi:hypothetical protein GCM10023211_02760 [Orbus sasakiae]|uniref:Uncharacterized protein n=1 Tax=Orbus sasakiae TaxID=1078475 RepID=A0ABP9N0Z5_9GAMM